MRRRLKDFLSWPDMQKDARLTIRVPKRLKDRLVGIERVYGVGLPKIANESFTAFCEYVKQKEQTPTFPILVSRTNAGTEGQLKLFAENLPSSTDLNGGKPNTRPKKIKQRALVTLDVASAEEFKISRAKNIERPSLAFGRIFGCTIRRIDRGG